MLKKMLIFAAFVVQIFLCMAVMLTAPHGLLLLVSSALGYGLVSCEWGKVAKEWAKRTRFVYGGVLGLLFFFFCLLMEWSDGALGFITAPAMLWLLLLPFWMRRKKTLRTWLIVFVAGTALLLLGLGALYIIGSGLAVTHMRV
ncbi:MAG: hypothetical protein FWC28_06350 [Proteobacteria bacterium]|nr:hypothetical protein [Cystobacterineae bacterium]MCL2314854.1 hypothetical protein [Pseudomonadota bacterium]